VRQDGVSPGTASELLLTHTQCVAYTLLLSFPDRSVQMRDGLF
jgi:hypothetical protein